MHAIAPTNIEARLKALILNFKQGQRIVIETEAAMEFAAAAYQVGLREGQASQREQDVKIADSASCDEEGIVCEDGKYTHVTKWIAAAIRQGKDE